MYCTVQYCKVLHTIHLPTVRTSSFVPFSEGDSVKGELRTDSISKKVSDHWELLAQCGGIERMTQAGRTRYVFFVQISHPSPLKNKSLAVVGWRRMPTILDHRPSLVALGVPGLLHAVYWLFLFFSNFVVPCLIPCLRSIFLFRAPGELPSFGLLPRSAQLVRHNHQHSCHP